MIDAVKEMASLVLDASGESAALGVHRSLQLS